MDAHCAHAPTAPAHWTPGPAFQPWHHSAARALRPCTTLGHEITTLHLGRGHRGRVNPTVHRDLLCSLAAGRAAAHLSHHPLDLGARELRARLIHARTVPLYPTVVLVSERYVPTVAHMHAFLRARPYLREPSAYTPSARTSVASPPPQAPFSLPVPLVLLCLAGTSPHASFWIRTS